MGKGTCSLVCSTSISPLLCSCSTHRARVQFQLRGKSFFCSWVFDGKKVWWWKKGVFASHYLFRTRTEKTCVDFSHFITEVKITYCQKTYQDFVWPVSYPPAMTMVANCAQCQNSIQDEWLYSLEGHQGQTVSSVLHKGCLRCVECGDFLESKCYASPEGHYYCKRDYYRLYGPRCGGCHRPFDLTEEATRYVCVTFFQTSTIHFFKF